jgi:hypothetical protein
MPETKVKKSEDFNEWYNEIVELADLCDKRYPIKGMNIWRPYGWKVMNHIDRLIRDEMETTCHQEVYFPLLIPESFFKKEACPVLFDKRFKIKSFGEHPVIIGSGWKPGWSTDFVTIQIAVDLGIKSAILLGKPDYVYTSNPDKNKNAKPIEKMSWKDYFKLIPKKWTPGLHAPVDPIGAKLAQKENLRVIVASGRDFKNLKNILENKKSKGTLIF